MGADIGGIDVTHSISRDSRCRSAAVDSVQIGRIGNKGAQRTVNGAADHDAAQLARLRSRRLVAGATPLARRTSRPLVGMRLWSLFGAFSPFGKVSMG